MKENRLQATLPVGYAAVKVEDFAALRTTINQLRSEIQDSAQRNAKLVRELNEAEKRVEVSENQIKDLQRKLDDKEDVIGFWYQKAKALEEQCNAAPEEA